MAQLRQDYQEFVNRNVVLIVIGPENASAFGKYFQDHDLPFTGLPDPDHIVLNLYGQQVRMIKMGRMPAQALIDPNGIIRFIHYGQDMSDIPSTAEMLQLIDRLKVLEKGNDPTTHT